MELEADFDLRIERNKTPNRLANKPTKRNIQRSESIFRQLESQHRLNSYAGEIQTKNYLRINNTDLSAAEAAQVIKNTFSL